MMQGNDKPKRFFRNLKLLLWFIIGGVSVLCLVGLCFVSFFDKRQSGDIETDTSGDDLNILGDPPPGFWYGQIPSAVTDSYEWDMEEGRISGQNAIIRVNDSEYYLIVVEGNDGSCHDGWAKTIQVYNDNGSIMGDLADNNTVSSFEFDDSDGYGAVVCHISGTDKYVVAYKDTTGTKLTLVTLQVWDNNGTINPVVIDSQQCTLLAYIYSITLIDMYDNVFVVAYSDDVSSNGWMETWWIDDDGAINNTILDSEEFDTSNGYSPSVCKVDTDTLLITYKRSSATGDYSVMTYNISSSGIITDTPSDSWYYESEPSSYTIGLCEVDKVGSNTYAVTYVDANWDIYTKTLTIDDTGLITESFIDTLVVNDTVGYTNCGNLYTFFVHDPKISSDGSGIMGVTFYNSSTSADGWVFIWNVSSTGVLGDTIIDSLKFNTYTAMFSPVLYVNQSWYLIVFADSGTDGYSCIVEIGTNWASPVASSPSPVNESTNQALTPTCYVTVNDTNGDTMDVTFATNESGSWVNKQTNTSVNNGTCYWLFSDADTEATTYYWMVYVDDGIHNISETYSFTTLDAAAIYYVSNAGADSNNGTSTLTPWQNISKVNTQMNGGIIGVGDDVYFKRGDTWTDRLEIRTGGSSSNWMIIGAYDTGAKPVIDTTSDGNGIIIYSNDVGYVKIQDFEIIDQTVNGIQAYDKTGLNNITVFNVDINNSGNVALLFNCVDHYIVENCTANNSDNSGFGFIGNDGDTTQNGQILNCTCTNVTANDGFAIHGDDYGYEAGSNHYIYNCVGSYCGEQAFDITSGENIYIKDCEGYSNGDSSIVFGHRVTNVTVDNFYSHDENTSGSNAAGFYFTECGNITIRNSVIWNIYNNHIVIGDGTSPQNNITFYHNTLVWDGVIDGIKDGYFIRVGDNSTRDIVFKNNIFYSRNDSEPDTFLYFSGAKNVTNTYSNYTNNMWWRGDDGAEDDTWWRDGSLGMSWNLAEWQSLSETTGETRQNATFVDVTTGDFNLQASSPYIDAGVNLTQTSDGGTGTGFSVDNSNYFMDGYGLVDGDIIFVGDDSDLMITEINYDTDNITVNRSFTWTVDEEVGFSFNGSAPDIGAYESNYTADSTPPSITINFAGNLSDLGGPYWTPPDEKDALNTTMTETDWRDGYYTNDSYQSEDWIYINTTVEDDWYHINSSHLADFCGEGAYKLSDALDGLDYWYHAVNEEHWFIIDLGNNYTITKVRGRSYSNNDPILVDIYVSTDNSTWGTAVATGISTWQDTGKWQEVDTTDKNGRYVRVNITDTESASNYISFGSIYAYLFPIFDVQIEQSNTSTVMMHWMNETTYTGWYSMTNTVGNYWEYNTSGVIQTSAGYNYSFDIVANDTNGNSQLVGWNKTGMYGDVGNIQIRRYIHLNCTSQNITYTPFYCYKITNTHNDDNDDNVYDRLDHDQGTDYTNTDNGYLHSATPDDDIDNIYCSDFIGYWFDENICVSPFTIENIYYHLWYSCDPSSSSRFIYHKTRGYFTGSTTNSFSLYHDQQTISNISYNGGTSNDLYFLICRNLPVTSDTYTDNNIYELVVKAFDVLDNPSAISNRSISSFVLINVPSNETLNASYSDSDGDTLSDWTELYVNYTNPFLMDTDYDGINDNIEVSDGTDPNNYTDYIPAGETRIITEVFDYYFNSGGNVTVRSNTTIFDYYFNTGGNITTRANTTIFDYYFNSGGNLTTRVNTTIFDYYFNDGGNITAINNSIPSIEAEYPVNGSTGIDTTPTCYVTVNDSNDDTMNISWWTNATNNIFNNSHSSVIIKTASNVPYCTRMPAQRNLWYAVGRWWAFFCINDTGNYRVYSSSIDGITWDTPTYIRDGGSSSGGAEFSTWVDSDNIHYMYAYGADHPPRYRMGTLNSNGTIIWIAAEQSINEWTACWDVTICVDTNGYPWVTWMNTTSYYPVVAKSSTKDGNWTMQSGFPYELNNSLIRMMPIVVPLTNGKVYVVYGYNYDGGTPNYVYGRLWNGTGFEPQEQASATTVSGYFYGKLVALSIGDDVHVGFTDNLGNIKHIYRNYSTGTWSSEAIIYSYLNITYDGSAMPVISKTQDNDLFAFWFDYEDDAPYNVVCFYERWNHSNYTWYNQTKWFIDNSAYTAEDIGNVLFSVSTSSYSESCGKIGLMYRNGTTPNYSVKFNYIDMGRSWVKFGENLSVTNNTFYQKGLLFNETNTTYWWSVNVSDGTGWCNETYSFTTLAGEDRVVTEVFDYYFNSGGNITVRSNTTIFDYYFNNGGNITTRSNTTIFDYYFNNGGNISAPVVTTNASTNIGINYATINGYLNDDGGEPCELWFEYGPTISYGNRTYLYQEYYQENYDEQYATANTSYGYVYVNYTKPTNGTVNFIRWMVKHGMNHSDSDNPYWYNITLDGDYLNVTGGKIQLRMYCTIDAISGKSRSAPYAYNGTSWVMVGTYDEGSTVGSADANAAYTRAIDGDWGTEITRTSSNPSNWGYSLTGECRHGRFYEEGITWNITNYNDTGDVYSIALTGLSTETVYHYRIVAKNSNYVVYGNDMIFNTTVNRSITTIFDYYFNNGGNTTIRTNTTIFDYYFNNGGNVTTRTNTMIFDYYFNNGGNSTTRSSTTVFDYYFNSGGNITTRSSTTVFDYYFNNGGNATTRTGTTVFDYYFNNGGNQSRTSTTVFDYYFNNGGNTTNAVVVTNAATDLSIDNVTLNGYLEDDGGENCTVGFEYGPTIGYGTQVYIVNNWDSIESFEEWANGVTDKSNIYDSNNATYAYASGNIGAGQSKVLCVWDFDSNDTREIMYKVSEHSEPIYNQLQISNDNISYTTKVNLTGGNDKYESGTFAGDFRYLRWYVTNPAASPIGGGQWRLWNLEYRVGFDTGDSFLYNLTSLTTDITYHYRAFAQNSNTTVYGDDVSFETGVTRPEAPTDLMISFTNLSYVTLSWTKGTNANTTVVVKKTTGLPTSITDGTIIYNDTGTSSIQPYTISETAYYRAWSYANWSNPDSYKYSYNGTNFTLGGLFINCYDEDTLVNLTFNVSISNNDGSEVYNNWGCTNSHYINATLCPQGLVSILVSSMDYSSRMYYMTISPGIFYILNTYLPRESGEGAGGDCSLHPYMDSITVSTHLVDLQINLTYDLEEIITVEIYNQTLYGTYGGWYFVTNDKYSYTTDSIVINKSALDENTTMARVNYYYLYCPGDVINALYYLKVEETISLSTGSWKQSVENAYVEIKKYINTSGVFSTVSSLYTDANGYINVYLIPETRYKVFISKEGYNDTISDYWPLPPNDYGQTAEKIFDIIKIITTPEENITILLEDVIVTKYNTSTFWIYYINLNNNTVYTNFTIYDGDDLIYSYNESSAPNEVNIYWDYTLYDLTNDILRLNVVSTKVDDSMNTFTRYLNIHQVGRSSESASAPIMMIISVGLCLFGLTLVNPKHVFGVVGIIVMIIAIAVTAFAYQTWYIHLIQAVEIILLMFVFLVFKEEGAHAV